MPAPTGMRLFISMSIPCPVCPVSSRKHSAAFTARLRSSPGMKRRLLRARTRPLPSSVTVTSSHSETVCMTMSMSW